MKPLKLIGILLIAILTSLAMSTGALAKKGDKPGGGGKVLNTLEGQFTSHSTEFAPTDPLLTTMSFSMASNDEFSVGDEFGVGITPKDSTIELKLGGLLVRVKGGKAAGVLVFLSEADFAQGGSPVYETGMLPIDPAVPVSATFTLHVHANGVPVKSGKSKPSIGTISIGDLVFTPTP